MQQFVNTKTNRPVSFLVEIVQHEGNDLTIIKINQAQERPIFLVKDYGRLRKNIMYIRRGSSTGEVTPDEIVEMGRDEEKALQEEKRPDIILEFEYSLETWWDRPLFGPGQDNPKPYMVHILRMIAHNQGAVFARYVQGSVELPAAILWHHTNPEQIPGSLEGEPIARISLTNELSDPPSHPLGIPSKPKLRPLLPGSRLELHEEKLFPIPDLIDSDQCVIRWEIQGDNAIARIGTVILRDVPKTDKREVPDAEFG